jgi:hypothetical protein
MTVVVRNLAAKIMGSQRTRGQQCFSCSLESPKKAPLQTSDLLADLAEHWVLGLVVS